MENINKDTNTLVDNEVTDIFEEIASEPKEPVHRENPDQPSAENISDIEGNNLGCTNETSGYELQDPSHYRYQEEYNWRPEGDMTYPAPHYPRHDQSSNTYNHTHMIAHPDYGYLNYNNEHQPTEIGLRPTGYWSNNEPPPSTMDMHPTTATNTEGYGYTQATSNAVNSHRECSTQTESRHAPTEARPWFQTTRIQREAASSTGEESAAAYIVLSIFVMLFCCMPLGIVALIVAVLGQHEQNREKALSRLHASAYTSAAGFVSGSIACAFFIVQLVGTE